MSRRYELSPRPSHLGGGWALKLFDNSEEAGGGIFGIPSEDARAGMDWWNALSEERRAHWLMMAASAMPAAARHAYLLAEAYDDAMDEGEAWVRCSG